MGCGAGFLGNIFVNEVVFTSHDYLVEQGMAHELAHSWWGNLANASYPTEGAFLGEGMAEYAAWRGLGVLRDNATRAAGMRMDAVWYMYRRPDDIDVPILAPNAQSSPSFVHVTYHKGALVLRALEEAVGADAFAAALQAFVARGYGQLTVAGLVEEVAAAGDYDATTFVNEWLYRTGFPRIVVAPQVEGGEVTLSLEVVGDFHLHAPVRFTFADGTTREEAVELSPGANEHAFSLDERPSAVEIDPRWTMAREVSAALPADVTCDGELDAADLVAVALQSGAVLPEERRVDGGYDPLYDVDRDRVIGDLDLEAVLQAALAP
jgi:aminopeptidase N